MTVCAVQIQQNFFLAGFRWRILWGMSVPVPEGGQTVPLPYLWGGVPQRLCPGYHRCSPIPRIHHRTSQLQNRLELSSLCQLYSILIHCFCLEFPLLLYTCIPFQNRAFYSYANDCSLTFILLHTHLRNIVLYNLRRMLLYHMLTVCNKCSFYI